MKLSQLVATLPSLDTPPQSDPDITLFTADSRQVIPGALFIAYPSVSVDGHRFISDAIQRGAAAVVGECDRDEIIPQSSLRSVPLGFRITCAFVAVAKPSPGSTPRGTISRRAADEFIRRLITCGEIGLESTTFVINHRHIERGLMRGCYRLKGVAAPFPCRHAFRRRAAILNLKPTLILAFSLPRRRNGTLPRPDRANLYPHFWPMWIGLPQGNARRHMRCSAPVSVPISEHR